MLAGLGAALAEGAAEAALVEKIDIGGPTLLRAAAKNFERVTVVPDPAHYPELMTRLADGGGRPDRAFRRRMAAAAIWLENSSRAISGASTRARMP